MKIPPEALAFVGLDPQKPQNAASFFGALASLAPRLALADSVLAALGETDPVRAKGLASGKLARLSTLEADSAKAQESLAAVTRERRWEKLVDDGAVQLPQAFAREDGPPGPDGKRVYAKWAALQNAAFPELNAFLGWADSLPVGAFKPDAPPGPSTALADAGQGRPVQLNKRTIERARRSGLAPEDMPALALMVSRAQRGAADPAEREGV